MGRRFSDSCVQSDIKFWPFEVTPDPGDKPMILVNDKGRDTLYSAEEISAMILIKMKDFAEAFLGSVVKYAVVTVPANFNISQRLATKEACFISGLKLTYIINEPTAAALAYGLNRKATNAKNVLIFDLGGGTLDISLLKIKECIIKVISTNSDTHIGGEDFDDRMMVHFMMEFKIKHNKDISNNARALRTLKIACEKAKRTLSSTAETTIEIESFYEGVDFYSTITRTTFEELNIDLFQKCMDQVEKFLSKSKMKKTDVHEVVLVGGSTWIPKVQQLLQDFFNGKDLRKSINPDEVVAYGAAIQAAILSDEGNQNFQDKLLGNFCNRIIEKCKKLEAKSALKKYLYHMRNTVKKIEDAIDEATLWLDANHLAEANVFEDKMKNLESVCNPIIANIYQNDNDVARWSMDVHDKKNTAIVNMYEGGAFAGSWLEEENTRNPKAKNELENYVYNMGNTVKDEIFGEKLGVTDKKKIEDAIDEAILWLDANQLSKANEFEYKLKDLEIVCNPIIVRIYEGGEYGGWWMEEENKKNLKAKNAFENYLYHITNVVKDENSTQKFGVVDTKNIEDAIEEAILWLDANQFVEADEYESNLKRLTSVCTPIIANMDQNDVASWPMDGEHEKNLQAKHILQDYVYRMRNAMIDRKIGAKFSVIDKKKIADAIEGVIALMDANQLAKADEFEYKLKELEGFCNPIIEKMYLNDVADWSMDEEHKKTLRAKNELENYVYKMKYTAKYEKFWAKFCAKDKKIIEDAVNADISWLEANQLAEADDYEFSLEELKSVCVPIIAEMYHNELERWSMDEEH